MKTVSARLGLYGLTVALVGQSGCQEQLRFASADDAVVALDDAVQNMDSAEIRRIFGARTEELKSGDADQDADDFVVFSRRLAEARQLEPKGDDQMTLLIGRERWPFAVPLVKEGDQWRYDTDAGIEELTDRRIGRNERMTIAACRTLIDAQAEYFARNPDGMSLKHYAQRLNSEPDKKDGLYWPTWSNEEPSPIGPVFAEAAVRSDTGQHIPFHGYSYKLLTRQGARARGGEMDYMEDGRLVRGWAALAYPAEYGETGIMSFIFGSEGVVYEADLGDDTPHAVRSITSFDPGDEWSPVKP